MLNKAFGCDALIDRLPFIVSLQFYVIELIPEDLILFMQVAAYIGQISNKFAEGITILLNNFLILSIKIRNRIN